MSTKIARWRSAAMRSSADLASEEALRAISVAVPAIPLDSLPVILGDLYSPIISWDFLFSSSPVSAHDDVSGSKVVSRGCVVSFWTSNGADKVDFCHLKSP